jgi:fibronectin type 3 domain-containing protein
MNKIKIAVLSTFFSLICFGLVAQQSTIIPKAQSFDGNRIKIRWIIAGDSSLLGSTNQESILINVWDRFVKNGFVIDRRLSGNNTIQRTFTAKPNLAKLEDGIINFPTQAERDASRILKKMIFGTKNSMYAHPETVSNEKEVRQRYFYSMLASASSFKASCAAGLAIIDEDVATGATYEYTIREANKEDNAMAINYSAKVIVENVSVTIQNNSPQRQASLLPIARFGNKMVELKWRWRKPNALNSYQDLYYAYYVERAIEPTAPNLPAFERITAAPFLATDLKTDTLRFVDRDTTKANSVLQNGKKYVYRLIGKTYFDEDVIATQTVSGKCEDDTRYYPMITSEKLSPNNQVELNWTLPVESAMYRFKTFSIGRSERIFKDSLFKKIPIGPGLTIDSTKRTAIVNHSVSAKNTTKAAYYVVIGTTKDGEDFPSFPVLVQGIDSIAPVPPVNVKAIWNESSKTATITWNANTELDLLGYKIYRCLPGGIPIAISDTAINKNTTYTDTVKVANLKVLYYIGAIDYQFNPSKLSAPGILKIPDNDPPIKPYFGNFKINNQGHVELNIYPSPSPDIASHELRRNIDTQISSLNIWTTPEKPSSYIDNGLTSGGKLSYVIEAIDSTGNKSSDTLDIDVPSILIAKPQFTLLNSSASRIDPSIKLNWDYSVVSASNEVREFVLLKCDVSIDPTGRLGTWKTVSGDTREISDFDVFYERTYKYGVKAIFKDGSSSTWLYTTLTMPTVCGAAKYLEEQGKLIAGDNVLKEACGSIRLLPGFHAPINSVFHAVIKKK